MAGLTGENFGHRDAFLFGLVRQHRPGDNVADRVDAGDTAAVMRIDHDAAAIVLLHADAFEIEARCIGHAADGDKDDVRFERFRVDAARGRLDFHFQRLA